MRRGLKILLNERRKARVRLLREFSPDKIESRMRFCWIEIFFSLLTTATAYLSNQLLIRARWPQFAPLLEAYFYFFFWYALASGYRLIMLKRELTFVNSNQQALALLIKKRFSYEARAIVGAFALIVFFLFGWPILSWLAIPRPSVPTELLVAPLGLLVIILAGRANKEAMLLAHYPNLPRGEFCSYCDYETKGIQPLDRQTKVGRCPECSKLLPLLQASGRGSGQSPFDQGDLGLSGEPRAEKSKSEFQIRRQQKRLLMLLSVWLWFFTVLLHFALAGGGLFMIVAASLSSTWVAINSLILYPYAITIILVDLVAVAAWIGVSVLLRRVSLAILQMRLETHCQAVGFVDAAVALPAVSAG